VENYPAFSGSPDMPGPLLKKMADTSGFTVQHFVVFKRLLFRD
jgi:hypothetical protein